MTPNQRGAPSAWVGTKHSDCDEGTLLGAGIVFIFSWQLVLRNGSE